MTELHRPSLTMMTERMKTARSQNIEWQDLVVYLAGALPESPIHQGWTETASVILKRVYGIHDLQTVKKSGLRVIQSPTHLQGYHTHDGESVCNSSYGKLNRVIGIPNLDE